MQLDATKELEEFILAENSAVCKVVGAAADLRTWKIARFYWVLLVSALTKGSF